MRSWIKKLSLVALFVLLALAVAGLAKANDKTAMPSDVVATMCASTPVHDTSATLQPAPVLVVRDIYAMPPRVPQIIPAVVEIRSSFHTITSARRAAVMVWHPPEKQPTPLRHSDGGWA